MNDIYPLACVRWWMMTRQEDTRLIGEVIDAMADQSLKDSEHVVIAIERFSSAVDRLLTWLPAKLREDALEFARAHGYSTSEQLARMRQEINCPN